MPIIIYAQVYVLKNLIESTTCLYLKEFKPKFGKLVMETNAPILGDKHKQLI